MVKEFAAFVKNQPYPSGNELDRVQPVRMKSQRQLMWMSFPFIAFIAIFAYMDHYGAG